MFSCWKILQAKWIAIKVNCFKPFQFSKYWISSSFYDSTLKLFAIKQINQCCTLHDELTNALVCLNHQSQFQDECWINNFKAQSKSEIQMFTQICAWHIDFLIARLPRLQLNSYGSLDSCVLLPLAGATNVAQCNRMHNKAHSKTIDT